MNANNKFEALYIYEHNVLNWVQIFYIENVGYL